MKKLQIFLALLFFGILANAQVGIGTTTPAATLDVKGTPTNNETSDGVIFPTATCDQVGAKQINGVANYGLNQTGLLLNITSVAPSVLCTNLIPALADVVTQGAGLYQFNGTKFEKVTVGASASNTPNIYTQSGTITAAEARTVGFGAGSSLNFDSNTLFINGDDNRVGIGNTNPSTPLNILATAKSPVGGLAIQGADFNGGVGTLYPDGVGAGQYFVIQAKRSAGGAAPTDKLYNTASWVNANIVLNPQGGNVGIGISPTSTLHVSGTANITGNSTIGGTLGVTGATTVGATANDKIAIAAPTSLTPFTGTIATADLSLDRTWTFPNADGNVLLSSTGFQQDGNSFGVTAVLGTNDAFNLAFETGGTPRALLNTSGNLLFNNGAVIGQNTADGSDNGVLILSGGGADGSGRGARIALSGNERAVFGSSIDINAGVGGVLSAIRLQTNDTERMRIDNAGNVSVNDLATGVASVATDRVVVAVDGTGELKAIDAAAYTDNIYTANGTIPLNTARTVGFGANSSLNFDSNTLFINGDDNRVGIGNPTPSRPLDVVGTAIFTGGNVQNGFTVDTNTLSVDASANRVGIGTTSPNTALEVVTGASFIRMTTTDGVGSNGGFGLSFNISNTPHEFARIAGNYETSAAGGSGGLHFNTRSAGTLANRMTIAGNGNVGIGGAAVTTPSQPLDVDGNVRFRGQIFDSSGSSGVVGQLLTKNASNQPQWISSSSSPAVIGAFEPAVSSPNFDACQISGGGVTLNNFYTGTSITLPVGKWLVTVNNLSTTTGVPANSSMWVRTTFSHGVLPNSGNPAFTDINLFGGQSSHIQGSPLISGVHGDFTKYALIGGAVRIENPGPGSTEYHLWLRDVEFAPTGIITGANCSSVDFFKFGSANWQENQLYAIPYQ